jgi:hypothetical protein
MAEVGAPWPAMGSSVERGRRGKGKEERGRRCGAPWGGGGLHEGRQACSLAASAVRGLFVPGVAVRACCTCETGRRKEERREEKKRKKKKRGKKEKI